MANLCLEKITGLTAQERRLHDSLPLTPAQASQLEQYKTELITGRPIQYVLEEAWFQEMPFYVNESVLIPRPETEELVEWVVKEARGREQAFSLIDVGTGSGCIPVSLYKKLPLAHIHGCDASAAALELAARNALQLGAHINWILTDFLDPAKRNAIPPVDLIISNPPYIPISARNQMDNHITAFEPAMALFVPDGQEMIFYEAVADFAKEQNRRNIMIYVEIHEGLAEKVMGVFEKAGLTDILLKKDMQGKDRMIRAST